MEEITAYCITYTFAIPSSCPTGNVKINIIDIFKNVTKIKA